MGEDGQHTRGGAPTRRSIPATVWQLVTVLVGTAGLRLDRPLRQIAVTLILLVATLGAQVVAIQRGHAVACCIAVGIFYYVGNTAACIRPVSERLRTRFGEARCVLVHETSLGVAFANQGLALSGVATATATAGTFALPAAVIAGICVVLTVVGVVTKYWATFLTGLDTYYYQDLFIRRPVGDLVTRGPYRWLNSPMYGFGNVHAYVPALLAGSGVGLGVALAFHAAIYAFLILVERPFVNEVMARGSLAT